MHGYLTIVKEEKDGTKEIIFQDENMITEGFGRNIVNLWSGASLNVENFRIRYFKIGKSKSGGIALNNPSFYDVSVGLTNADYGANSNVKLVVQNQLKLNNTFLSTSSFITSSNVTFGEISPNAISRVDGSAVEFYFMLDENTALNLPIQEVALFATNPDNESVNKPIMVCYRALANPITKTDYTLHYYWLIGPDG